MSEYHEVIHTVMLLGKTYQEAIADWKNLNSMQPIYCQIIKDYPCECETILPATR